MVGEARARAEENSPKGKTGKRRKPAVVGDPGDGAGTGDPPGRPPGAEQKERLP